VPGDPERVVFEALLEDHPGPFSRAEVATLLGDRIAAADAVSGRQRDGLADVEGSLVFASRAAVRADQLTLCLDPARHVGAADARWMRMLRAYVGAYG
jgi:hypothetical protein